MIIKNNIIYTSTNIINIKQIVDSIILTTNNDVDVNKIIKCMNLNPKESRLVINIINRKLSNINKVQYKKDLLKDIKNQYYTDLANNPHHSLS